jgi:hypothetical protein
MPQHSMAQHRSTGSLNAGSEAVCPSTVCTAFMMAWPFMAGSVCCRHLGTCNWQLPAQPARPTLQRRLAGRHACMQTSRRISAHHVYRTNASTHLLPASWHRHRPRSHRPDRPSAWQPAHGISHIYTHPLDCVMPHCCCATAPKVPNTDQQELYYQAGPDALKVQVATTPRCCCTGSSIDGTYAPCGLCFYRCHQHEP